MQETTRNSRWIRQCIWRYLKLVSRWKKYKRLCYNLGLSRFVLNEVCPPDSSKIYLRQSQNSWLAFASRKKFNCMHTDDRWEPRMNSGPEIQWTDQQSASKTTNSRRIKLQWTVAVPLTVSTHFCTVQCASTEVIMQKYYNIHVVLSKLQLWLPKVAQGKL